MTFQYFNIGPILTGRGLWLIAFWAWFQAPRSTLGPEAQQPTCSCSEVPRTFFDGGPVLGRLAAGEFQAKVKEHSELIESYQPLGRCYGPREPYACPYQDRLVIPPGCFNVNPTMIIPRVNVWMITPHINELGVSKRPGLTQRLTFCERFFRAGLPPRLQRLVSKGCQEWPVFAVLPGGKHSDAGLLQ